MASVDCPSPAAHPRPVEGVRQPIRNPDTSKRIRLDTNCDSGPASEHPGSVLTLPQLERTCVPPPASCAPRWTPLSSRSTSSACTFYSDRATSTTSSARRSSPPNWRRVEAKRRRNNALTTQTHPLEPYSFLQGSLVDHLRRRPTGGGRLDAHKGYGCWLSRPTPSTFDNARPKLLLDDHSGIAASTGRVIGSP